LIFIDGGSVLTQQFMNMGIFLLNNAIEKEAGIIIGPICKVLGFIMDIIFNMVYSITEANSLGISIIIFTIIIRVLMMPLAIKSQKSSEKMQAIQPELDKIKKKYEKLTDTESQRKMQVEMNALLSKSGVNQFAGCLPMFIQLPIFFALTYLMRQSYLFIAKLGSLYEELAKRIMDAPGYIEAIRNSASLIMKNTDSSISINLLNADDVMRVLNKFISANWYGDIIKVKTGLFSSVPTQVTGLLEQLSPASVNNISEILNQKESVELFFGLNLVEQAGLSFPGILIPILCALTTFLSSYIMYKQSKSQANAQAIQTQKTMMTVMPIMMGFMTISISSGVGIYWITSSVFQVFQQIIMNKYFRKREVAKR